MAQKEEQQQIKKSGTRNLLAIATTSQNIPQEMSFRLLLVIFCRCRRANRRIMNPDFVVYCQLN